MNRRSVFLMTLAVFALSACFQADALAWKPKTHSFLGYRLVKECNDHGGWVEVPPYGYFKVPAEHLELITTYNAYFMGGTVGPDAYADIYIGQAFIHPREGTTSGEWVKYLWDKACALPEGSETTDEPAGAYLPLNTGRGSQMLEDVAIERTASRLTRTQYKKACKAFVLGMMVHGACDLFGHTWVNSWAGGPFPKVTDGITSAEAQNIARHMLVETYVDQKIGWSADGGCSPRMFSLRAILFNGSVASGFNPLFQKTGFPKHLDVFIRLRQSLGDAIGRLNPGDWFQNLIRTYCINWVADIDTGLSAWVYANAEVGRLVTQGKLVLSDDEKGENGYDAVDVLQAWADQYLSSMCGEPDILVALDELFSDVMDYLAYLDPLAALKEEIKDRVLEWLCEEITGQDPDTLAAWMKNPANYIKEPLFPPNALARINGELGNFGSAGMDCWDNADENLLHNFEPFYNSLAMSKLVLIGHAGADELLTRALNRPVSQFNTNEGRKHPLVEFIGSFDESDWFKTAGFPLWGNTEYRGQVFHLLFAGFLDVSIANPAITSASLAFRKYAPLENLPLSPWYSAASGVVSNMWKFPTQVCLSTSSTVPLEGFVTGANHRLLFRGDIPSGSRNTFFTADLSGPGEIRAFVRAKGDLFPKGKPAAKVRYEFPDWRHWEPDYACHYAYDWDPEGEYNVNFPMHPYVHYSLLPHFCFRKLDQAVVHANWREGDAQMNLGDCNGPHWSFPLIPDILTNRYLDWANLTLENFGYSGYGDIFGWHRLYCGYYSNDDRLLIPGQEVKTTLLERTVNADEIHVNAVNFSGEIAPGQSTQGVLNQVKTEPGALSLISHPGCETTSAWAVNDPDEVLATSWPFFSGEHGLVAIDGRFDTDDMQSIDSWVKHRLLKGIKTRIVGGSGLLPPECRDLAAPARHDSLFTTRTVAYAPQPTTASVLSAVRSGYSYVSTGPDIAIYLLPYKRVNNVWTDGSFLHMGQTLYTATSIEPLRDKGDLYVLVPNLQDNPNLDIVVYKGTVGGTETVVPDSCYLGAHIWQVDVKPGLYYRAEVRSVINPRKRALTNPIWIDFFPPVSFTP
ncbi:MAG: zinc dependent phospholipase C family protein [Acidobacteria bacterium]|nr:zinc dependent phospholipase C family protein [Acidobacteriota bacterium]